MRASDCETIHNLTPLNFAATSLPAVEWFVEKPLGRHTFSKQDAVECVEFAITACDLLQRSRSDALDAGSTSSLVILSSNIVYKEIRPILHRERDVEYVTLSVTASSELRATDDG